MFSQTLEFGGYKILLKSATPIDIEFENYPKKSSAEARSSKKEKTSSKKEWSPLTHTISGKEYSKSQIEKRKLNEISEEKLALIKSRRAAYLKPTAESPKLDTQQILPPPYIATSNLKSEAYSKTEISQPQDNKNNQKRRQKRQIAAKKKFALKVLEAIESSEKAAPPANNDLTDLYGTKLNQQTPEINRHIEKVFLVNVGNRPEESRYTLPSSVLLKQVHHKLRGLREAISWLPKYLITSTVSDRYMKSYKDYVNYYYQVESGKLINEDLKYSIIDLYEEALMLEQNIEQFQFNFKQDKEKLEAEKATHSATQSDKTVAYAQMKATITKTL